MSETNVINIVVPADIGTTIKLGAKEEGKYDVDTSALDLDTPKFDTSLKTNEQGKLTVLGRRIYLETIGMSLATHVRDRIYTRERGIMQVGDSGIYVPFLEELDFSKIFVFARNSPEYINGSSGDIMILPLGSYFDGKESVKLQIADEQTRTEKEVTVHLRDGQLELEGDLPDLNSRLLVSGHIIYASPANDVSLYSQELLMPISFRSPEDAKRAVGVE